MLFEQDKLIASTADAAVSSSSLNQSVPSFRLHLSPRFLIISFLSASAFAFVVGRVCRQILLSDLELRIHHFNNHNNVPEPQYHQQHEISPPHSSASSSSFESNKSKKWGQRVMLPQPILDPDKNIPHTVYTSKQFDTGLATKSNSILARRPNYSLQGMELNVDGSLLPINSNLFSRERKDDDDVNTNLGDDDDFTPEAPEEIHEPSGQHLLVDIERVDANFLNSESRLAQAMMTLIETSGLTLLSYHCHALVPMGVSCVGVLLESHVSFHTWPIPGVITLDLFTCGNKPLEPLLPVIQDLFAIARQPSLMAEDAIDETIDPPHTQWSYKKRGFRRTSEADNNPEEVELSQFVLGVMDLELKEHVASIETKYQTLDIFDVLNPRFRRLESYEKSLRNDGSYESQHPELFRPDRLVYLDNIKQSAYYGEGPYHEALVHPAMFLHPHPKRVAILGGGEGATLREVLKHKTVEHVSMIEIDKIMVQAARRYLPEWSNCSAFGSTPSCWDDPRAELVFTDAITWFTKRFSKSKEMIDETQRFDVIIMDALDPSSIVDFSDALYDNEDFIGSLYNALTPKGVLVSQMGEEVLPTSAAKVYTRRAADDVFIDHLVNEGFESIKSYSDSHGGFLSVWTYLIAMKDFTSKERWFHNDAQTNLEIKKRILPTSTGGSPLRYFDGGLMMSIQYPSRVVENVFCRRVPTPTYCDKPHGFDPESPNVHILTLEVRNSTIPGAGRGLFFTQDVPKGAYLAIDAGVHDLLAMPSTRRVVKAMSQTGLRKKVWTMFDAYLFGYGWATDYFGDAAYSIDTSILTFLNHGCNRTNNVGTFYEVTEMTADPDRMPAELSDMSPVETEIYSPFFHRNFMIYINGADWTNRDIKAGEEVFDNYLGYLHEQNWKWGVMDLRAQCSKKTAGVVTDYENAHSFTTEY